ncbi:hypothetical protein ONZ45_g13153 [Pleurotus djamor]|nr:hypothetical protein ONZ45_g13153 [Pleurotus djamor]
MTVDAESVHHHTTYNASAQGFGHNTLQYTSASVLDDHSTQPSVLDTMDTHDMIPPEDFWSQLNADESEEDAPQARKRTYAGDNPLLVWMDERDTYVEEFLALEAPATTCVCPHCSQPAMFRCSQCFDVCLYCKPCIISHHLRSPFHSIDMWNGQFFEKRSLQSLGLRIQLGHPLGQPCVNPTPAFREGFVVITSHGVITCHLDFCNCGTAASKPRQLLAAQLFPATVIEPRSAATFEVLRLFQLLSFSSKVSGYEFYQSLVRLTDNMGGEIPDRYSVFMRIIRQWRHIRQLKRAGRGNESTGVAGTQPGELAVLCPACPHPDKNLPEQWDKLGVAIVWIYALFLAIDANFRLKRHSVSDDTRDPGLSTGLAYFVPERKYKDFLAAPGEIVPEALSNCNNYDAVKLATIRGGHGVSSSGVGTIECSRHDMKRPLYVNMDFLFFSSIENHAPQRCVISYDIACQWTRNLGKRALAYPSEVVGSRFHQIQPTYLVPKFHLYAHRDQCQVDFSFNLTPYVGRTDGESPERGWAAMNPVASSTKEMGPGSRRDTLDDHFGDYNWRKVITLHETLLRRIKEAVPERSEHVIAFRDLSNALPAESTLAFSHHVWAWEARQTTDNPYKSKVEHESLEKIRRKLAEEDEASAQHEVDFAIHDSVSPSVLIAQGLELEDQQARLALDAKLITSGSTDIQRTEIIERRTRLIRRITAWCVIQEHYMPGLVSLRQPADKSPSTAQGEHFPLMLPSAPQCPPRINVKLLEYEWRLRYGKALDYLDEIRRLLLVLSSMYQSKSKYSRGQQQNTRSIALIGNVQQRIKYTVERYRYGRKALESLAKRLDKPGWDAVILPLQDQDVRGLKEGDDAGSSEGRRRLSWIWAAQRTTDDEFVEGKNEALRIEWCKARARAHRWQEECILLSEEMRRVVQFHMWQANVWKRRAQEAPSQGAGAYAWRQHDVRQTLADRCKRAWASVETWIKYGEGAVVAGERLVEQHDRV